jgi:predicted RecB family nuclease
MNIVITSEVLKAYSLCPRKAYLLLYSKERGNLHEYEEIFLKNQLENQTKYLELLKEKYIDISPYSISNLEEKHEFLIDAKLVIDSLQARCAILIKTSKLNYEPTIVIGTHAIDHTDKLNLMFVGHVLAKIQGEPPKIGQIVNMKGESRKFKLEGSYKVITPLLEPLQDWLNESSPEEPPVILNKHCSICQFREECKEKAIQEDNLSLLDKVTPKIIRQYEKKGIFTVKQLSYLFKPRKRKKRAKNPPPITHNIELQALAIRTGKIYLQELPTFVRHDTELYLDIEGLPDENFYYLIGLLVCKDNRLKYHYFWAENTDKESEIWQEFLDFVAQYPDAPIYHYGSYEPRVINTLSKRYKTNSKPIVDRIININKQIYGKVYFPVYSNQLKEIARFVGATWTSPNASGLQSIVWRQYWDETHDEQYKSILLAYNQEDCQALKLLVDNLTKIKHSADTLSEVDFANKRKKQLNELGQQIYEEFEEILKFAHFDYDKKKISFRKKGLEESETNSVQPQKRMPEKWKPKHLEIQSRAKKLVKVQTEKICPRCNSDLTKETALPARRYIIDLVLTKNGIKKTISQYSGFKGFCKECRKNYEPLLIQQYPKNQVYGNGFGAWIIHQRVALRLPYESIVEASREYFNEEISVTLPLYFLQKFSVLYSETEKIIIDNLLKSLFIHVDETRVNIRGENWYVWVFANEKYVVYKLTETRESTIVHEFFNNYQGILISDFYPGYDSVECKQQKCWVHLIRDLNSDLQANPFDQEFENFIFEIRNLIIQIMETIHKYGLKKRNLNQFKKQVDSLYQRVLIDKKYKSDLVLKYQKRFIRYRDSLFTFLETDGIPWHNNTAERAIRPFAIQRDTSKSPLHESATRDYLTLLSIRQTCRFQGKSFFKFLFSGETDICSELQTSGDKTANKTILKPH